MKHAVHIRGGRDVERHTLLHEERVRPDRETTFPGPVENEAEIFVANRGLVYGWFRRHWHGIPPRCRRWLDMEDLHQWGFWGLLRAIRGHDPEKGKLSTHAWFWIRAYVHRGFRMHVTGRPGVSCTNYMKALRFVSMDYEMTDDERHVLKNLIGDPKSDPVMDMEIREETSQFQSALESLDDRSRAMLERRIEGETLEEVAVDYGLSRERIRQITSKAMVVLAKRLGTKSINAAAWMQMEINKIVVDDHRARRSKGRVER